MMVLVVVQMELLRFSENHSLHHRVLESVTPYMALIVALTAGLSMIWLERWYYNHGESPIRNHWGDHDQLTLRLRMEVWDRLVLS